jgi:lysophospholipase L1-like esterase
MPTARAWFRPALIALAAGVALAAVACTTSRLHEARTLAARSEPLQQQPAAPAMSMLVVGDSTAVGTGASSARTSLAGLIAAAHPRLELVNRAADGAKFEDLHAQLAAAGSRRFDIVLVQAGGNDVIRLTGEAALRPDVDRVLAQAKVLAPLVIVMPAGNVGNAPFFFAPLSWWMTARARMLHRVVREAAAAHGATYVDLFLERDDDPFVHDRTLNASDGLHPSDAGYRRWWDSLRRQAGLDQRLAAAR